MYRRATPELSPYHDCRTARYAGLAGLKNGDLFTAAETAKFDVFLTVDQGIEHQQNLAARKISIVVFCAKSNRLQRTPRKKLAAAD
jgi:hypothetical protein